MLYQVMGDYAKAEPLMRQALEIEKQVLVWRTLPTRGALNDLAVAVLRDGDYAKAEPLYRQAEIQRRRWARPPTTRGAWATSPCYIHSMVTTEGEPLYARPEIQKQALGERTGVRNDSEQPGRSYQSMGDSAKAEPLYRRRWRSRITDAGQTHPSYARA